MPNFSLTPVNKRFKILLCGPSGAGKTTQAALLANAGYNVNILDVDGNLAILHEHLKEGAAGRIHYESIAGRSEKGWEATAELLTSKPWGDRGPLSSWDENSVLFIDSGSFLCDTCLTFLKKKAGVERGSKFDQAVWGDLAEKFESMLATITGEAVKAHVVMTAHIRPVADERNIKKEYPYFGGQRLIVRAPAYFNSVFKLEVKPDGKRILRTQSTNLMDLKNVAPSKIKAEDVPDLGEIFRRVRDA